MDIKYIGTDVHKETISDHQPRSHPRHESSQGPVSKQGHWLCGAASLRGASRGPWLNRIGEAGVRRRAEFLASGASSRAAGSVGGEPETWGHAIVAADSLIGPMGTALLIALIQTPHRFRSKRQLWTYSDWRSTPAPVRNTDR